MRGEKRGLERVGGLTASERTRLARILAMLASPNDNERVVAARMATSFIEQHGLWWDDLAEAARPRPEPVAPQTVRPPACKYALLQRPASGGVVDLIG